MKITWNELFSNFRGNDEHHNAALVAAAIHTGAREISDSIDHLTAQVTETNRLLRLALKVPGPATSLKLTLGKPTNQ